MEISTLYSKGWLNIMANSKFEQKVFDYLEEHPRATMEELYQVFSNEDPLQVRLAIANLYSSNQITSVTVYLPMPEFKKGE